jgi:hypothetical protein
MNKRNNVLKAAILSLTIFNVGCATYPLEDFADIMTEEEKDKYLCKRVFASYEEYLEHQKKGYCSSESGYHGFKR